MCYWSYSALDGYNGQMILGYVPEKMLASVKGVPSIVDDPDDTRYADLNTRMFSTASKPTGPWRNNPVNAKHGGVLFKPGRTPLCF